MNAAVSVLEGIAGVKRIGPQTSETMVRHRLKVAAEASPYTLEGMVAAMMSYYTNINPVS